MLRQLDSLRTLCLVTGVFDALGAVVFGLTICAGILDMTSQSRTNSEDVCALIFFILLTAGSTAAAVLNFLVARDLVEGRRYARCMAATIVNLIPVFGACFPLGLAAGIFGLVVLLNDDIKEFFRRVAGGEKPAAARAAILNPDETDAWRADHSSRSRNPNAGWDDADDYDVADDWDQSKPKNTRGKR